MADEDAGVSAGPVHLARRFFGSVRARPLGPGEQAEAAALLAGGEAHLFWRQGAPDQRHALACARAVLAGAPGRRDLARAALLHDVGKGAARLGSTGRVLATALAACHLPVRGRLAAYVAHGPGGATELAAAGADPLTVAYARHHHGARPPEIDPGDWERLAAADRG